MKFPLLATTLLTLSLTPLSLATPTGTPTNTTVMGKCLFVMGDYGEAEAWFQADLMCNYKCQQNGFNGGGCDRASIDCLCS